MVNFALLRELGLDDAQATTQMESEYKDQFDPTAIGALLDSTGQSFANGTILKGKIVEVRAAAKYVTKYPGGYGAVRDAIEFLCKEMGLWQQVLDRYL